MSTTIEGTTTRTSDELPRVLIAGAGLGGLFLGIQLERAGIPYEIFERSTEMRPLGKSRCEVGINKQNTSHVSRPNFIRYILLAPFPIRSHCRVHYVLGKNSCLISSFVTLTCCEVVIR